jgi:hypothetical protein
MLTVLLLLVLQTPEPRFVMTPGPDDCYEAGLFELRPGDDRAALVDALMGRGPDSISLPEGEEQDRAFTFGAAEGSSGRRDRVCRIARTAGGQNDNLRRAMTWCASFIEPGAAPVVTLPPMSPPR